MSTPQGPCLSPSVPFPLGSRARESPDSSLWPSAPRSMTGCQLKVYTEPQRELRERDQEGLSKEPTVMWTYWSLWFLLHLLASTMSSFLNLSLKLFLLHQAQAPGTAASFTVSWEQLCLLPAWESPSCREQSHLAVHSWHGWPHLHKQGSSWLHLPNLPTRRGRDGSVEPLIRSPGPLG